MDSTAAGGNTGGMIGMIIVYAVIIAALYFFMIRPQSKKKKEEEAMRNNLEIGDEITTIGGIVGRVVSINDETDSLVIETAADRNKMRLRKWAISSIDNDKKDKVKPDKSEKSTKK